MKIPVTQCQNIRPHLLVVLLLILVMMLFLPNPVKADMYSAVRLSTTLISKDVADSNSLFSDITVIGSDELGIMRGGFKVGGLDINIGALVQTYIDGRLALHSQLTVTENGRINNIIASPASEDIPGSSVIITNGDGPSLQEVTPVNIDVDGLEGSEGVIVNDDRGYTAALQSVQNNRFLTTIINRASGRNIRHRVDIDVTIKNFKQLQRNMISARLAQRITNR